MVHVIICSHPDLNQQILIDLLKREDISGLWCATIGEVVGRCKSLIDYGAISILEGSNKSSINLISNNTVKDVHMEVYCDNIDEPVSICANLNSKKQVLNLLPCIEPKETRK